MASQDDSSFHISWPGIAAFLVAALGLIISKPSLQSPRPTKAAGAGKPPVVDSSVPARLWQDPLTAVQGGQQPAGDIASVVCGRPESPEMTKPQEKKKQPVLFLFDCIDPENTAEGAEVRRRERYSTLSALSTAGYAPVQPDRIQYATLSCKDWANLQFTRSPKGPGAAGRKWEAAMRIPYEWLLPIQQDQAGLPANQQQPCRYQAVCVLWVNPLPDSSSQLSFLCSLKAALESACPCEHPTYKFAITGRIGSSQLKALIQEKVTFARPPKRKPLENVTLYVTNSTAPFVRTPPQEQRIGLNLTGLKLEYIIDTDQRLAADLVEELKRRRFNPGTEDHPIAIIAEWDTEYGRDMHSSFDAATCGDKKHVCHYSYLRGLDGQVLRSAPGDQKTNPVEDDRGAPGGGPKPSADKPTAKEGEGESQIDYLRRLAERMKADGHHFKAIGIVGSDVYDKLLLLKALGPVFPNAVFFTTDLDVRLLQPGDYSDTRNLLIASHYGLFLKPAFQGMVAPFRGSYDTASYLGCLRAVKYPKLQTQDEGNPWDVVAIASRDQWNGGLLVPRGKEKKGMPIRLYEVGRSGAYELTLREDDQLEPPNQRLQPSLLTGAQPWYLLGIALVAGMLLYPVSRPWQRFLRSVVARGSALFARLGRRETPSGPVEEDQGRALAWVLGLVAAGLALVLAILIYIAHTTEGQESFELYEGVSVWPTVVLRLLAAGLCVYYIASALKALAKRNRGLTDDFSFPAPERTYPHSGFSGAWAALRESCQAWTQEPEQGPEVRKLCEQFAKYGVPWRRAYRSGLLAALNLALFVLLWRLFDPTIPQARGWIAQSCYIIVLVLTLLALPALLMFVVDSTLLSYRFVVALVGLEGRKWPTTLLADAARKWGLEVPVPQGEEDIPEAGEIPQAVGQWLSLRLIDAVTNVVAGRLIYYPFVVLLVLIVAQNRLFDNWHWNTPLALMALFNAGVAVVCAVLLQRAAKGARAQALGVLDGLLRVRVGSPEDPVREKFSQIRSDIDGINTGAFAGFYQNPVVGAILLPLGGGGGLAALEALLGYLAHP
jgi:hypothetical protein